MIKSIVNYFTHLGADRSAAISIVVSLIVFTFGEIFKFLYDLNKRLSQKKAFRSAFLFLLEDFKKSCQSQSESISKSLQTTGLKHGNNFIISYKPIATLNYLSSIDFSVLVKNFKPTFHKKKFTKSISKMLHYITLIKLNQKENEDLIIRLTPTFQKHEARLNRCITELRKINDEIVRRFSISSFENDVERNYALAYFQIFKDFKQGKVNPSIKNSYQYIVEKTFDLKNHFINTEFSQIVIDLSLDAKEAYLNIENIDNMLMENFKTSAHYHRLASKSLEIIIKILK